MDISTSDNTNNVQSPILLNNYNSFRMKVLKAVRRGANGLSKKPDKIYKRSSKKPDNMCKKSSKKPNKIYKRPSKRSGKFSTGREQNVIYHYPSEETHLEQAELRGHPEVRWQTAAQQQPEAHRQAAVRQAAEAEARRQAAARRGVETVRRGAAALRQSEASRRAEEEEARRQAEEEARLRAEAEAEAHRQEQKYTSSVSKLKQLLKLPYELNIEVVTKRLFELLSFYDDRNFLNKLSKENKVITTRLETTVSHLIDIVTTRSTRVTSDSSSDVIRIMQDKTTSLNRYPLINIGSSCYLDAVLDLLSYSSRQYIIEIVNMQSPLSDWFNTYRSFIVNYFLNNTKERDTHVAVLFATIQREFMNHGIGSEYDIVSFQDATHAYSYFILKLIEYSASLRDMLCVQYTTTDGTKQQSLPNLVVNIVDDKKNWNPDILGILKNPDVLKTITHETREALTLTKNQIYGSSSFNNMIYPHGIKDDITNIILPDLLAIQFNYLTEHPSDKHDIKQYKQNVINLIFEHIHNNIIIHIQSKSYRICGFMRFLGNHWITFIKDDISGDWYCHDDIEGISIMTADSLQRYTPQLIMLRNVKLETV